MHDVWDIKIHKRSFVCQNAFFLSLFAHNVCAMGDFCELLSSFFVIFLQQRRQFTYELNINFYFVLFYAACAGGSIWAFHPSMGFTLRCWWWWRRLFFWHTTIAMERDFIFRVILIDSLIEVGTLQCLPGISVTFLLCNWVLLSGGMKYQEIFNEKLVFIFTNNIDGYANNIECLIVVLKLELRGK